MLSSYIQTQADFESKWAEFLSSIHAVKEWCNTLGPEKLPPLEYMNIIGSATAQHYRNNMKILFEEICVRSRITSSSSVIDLGCGCGRLSTPMIKYLASGKFWGYDVWEDGINWCLAHLRRNDCQKFVHLNASDNYYFSDNSASTLKNRFRFNEVSDNSIDLVYAISVFTHLKHDDCISYISEISRVLKPKGLAYLTFFVLDSFFFDFRNSTGIHTAINPDPSCKYQTAYSGQDFFAGITRDYLEEVISSNSLHLLTFETGSWAQKPGSNRYQDLAIIYKA